MSATSLDTPRTAACQIEPVLSARWALRPRHLAVCVMFGGLFVYLNCLPLGDSRIWLCLHDGGWMIEHGSLPAVDAAQPLTEGMRVVHTAWLSEVLFALADRYGGPAYVSNLFALAMLGCLVVLGRVFYVRAKRVGVMLFGVGLVLSVGAGFDTYAGPEVFGRLCLALLLWLLAGLDAAGLPGGRKTTWGLSRFSRRENGTVPFPNARENGTVPLPNPPGAWPVWLAVGLLFAAWANLHGSFLLGVAVLICYAAAEAIHAGRRTRSLRAVLADRPTQHRVLLAQWALAASLLNPYGPRLIPDVLGLVRDEKVASMPQWAPLSTAAPGGLMLLGSLALLAVVLRHSRRRVRPVDVMLLGTFGAAAVLTARALGWYAVVYAFVLVPHVADVCSRLVPAAARRTSTPEPRPRLNPRSFTVSLLCGLALYVAFRWAPTSRVFLGGTPRDMASLVGSPADCGVAEYLRRHPSPGLIYAPIAWADWLVWSGAPDAKLLMTSNVQWVPRRIWSDYRRMSEAQQGWSKGMDRYGVETLVIDRQNQGYFARLAQRSAKYRTVYENDEAVVLERVQDTRPRVNLVQTGRWPRAEALSRSLGRPSRTGTVAPPALRPGQTAGYAALDNRIPKSSESESHWP